MGDLLQPGEEWARLVDDRHLKGEAWVSQQQVGALSEGLPVAARLLNGGELSGEVSYISRRADEATRTFYVEVILDNPERQRLAGGSAELTITLPLAPCIRFPLRCSTWMSGASWPFDIWTPKTAWCSLPWSWSVPTPSAPMSAAYPTRSR